MSDNIEYYNKQFQSLIRQAKAEGVNWPPTIPNKKKKYLIQFWRNK